MSIRNKRILLAGIFGLVYFSLLAVIDLADLGIPYLLWGLYILVGCGIMAYIGIANEPAPAAVNIILMVGVTCFAITIVDLATRPVLQWIKPPYRPHELYFHAWPRDPSLFRYDPSRSYEGLAYGDLAFMGQLPDSREYRTMRFETDAHGFRNSSTNAAKQMPPEIIVLGDSYGTGEGTTQEKTWVTLLEQRSHKRIYNLSMPGGPRRELVNLMTEYPRLGLTGQATLLWVLFTGNNLAMSDEGPMVPRPSGIVERFKMRLDRFRRQSPTYRFAKRLERKVNAKGQGHLEANPVIRTDCCGKPALFYQPYIDMARMSRTDILDHPNYTQLGRIFSSMQSFTESKNLRVCVIVLPSKEEVYDFCLTGGSSPAEKEAVSPFTDLLETLSRSNGFSFLDVTPFLRQEVSNAPIDERGGSCGPMLWWRDDTHLNEEGNEVVARIICDKLICGN